MMTIAEAISNLLFERETVVVPGLGTFVKKLVSAKVDLDAHRLTPPSSRVEFDAALREEDDLVVRYLTEHDGIAEAEAQKMLTAFVTDCLDALKTGKSFVVEGVGTLSNGVNGSMAFEADGTANFNSEAFGLTGFSVSPVQPVEPAQVDGQEESEDDDSDEKGFAWYWAVLAVCVLIGGFFVLRQLGVFQKKPKEPLAATNMSTEQSAAPTVIYDTLIEEEQSDADTTEVVIPALTRKVAATEYRVVAGCYDREENALWFANVLRDVGFAEAFYEQRGERWFVSFAHYATLDEALEALKEIRNNTTYQAWVLVPQQQ